MTFRATLKSLDALAAPVVTIIAMLIMGIPMLALAITVIVILTVASGIAAVGVAVFEGLSSRQ